MRFFTCVILVSSFLGSEPVTAEECSAEFGQTELGNCLNNLADKLESQMVLAFKQAHVAAQYKEKNWFGQKGVTKALEANQVAFERWRTTYCDLEAYKFQGGSGTAHAWLNCRIDATRHQTGYLKEFAEIN